ncbi:lysylphosphatidylglycerol synthase transmembrane domain-containing protein [Desulfobacterales bacterium HSG16]|nr:lysylphosphatidylglycerol synthase transmembrane domain-containing protein [Desulfobacterales bacterium HSG16]
MKFKQIVSLIVSIIISVAALILAFRHVELDKLGQYLASVNYWWIVPSVIAVLASFLLRALRWKIILTPAGKVGFFEAYHPLIIGFMINCILPGRVGEAIRPLILKKKKGIPFTAGLASVATERAFDIVMLGIIMGYVFFTVNMDPDLNIVFGKYRLDREMLAAIVNGMVKLLILLVLGMILICIEKVRAIIRILIMASPNLLFFAPSDFKYRIASRFCHPVANMVDNLAKGFSLLKEPSKIFVCLLLSTLIWILSAVSWYAMSKGCPGIGLNFLEVSAVMVIVCVFIALPSVPGYWGIWEAGGVFGMALFGIESQEAAGFTLANHAIQIIPVVIAGIISAVVMGISIKDVSHDYETEKKQNVSER